MDLCRCRSKNRTRMVLSTKLQVEPRVHPTRRTVLGVQGPQGGSTDHTGTERDLHSGTRIEIRILPMATGQRRIPEHQRHCLQRNGPDLWQTNERPLGEKQTATSISNHSVQAKVQSVSRFRPAHQCNFDQPATSNLVPMGDNARNSSSRIPYRHVRHHGRL